MQNFDKLSDEIKAAAGKLIDDGAVDVVIGFESGTLPMRSTPCFIRSKEDVDRIVWDSFCENNLARYLRKVKCDKAGIVAKGCDARSLVELIKENQLTRDKVVIIGVPCEGMIDRKLVEAEFSGREIIAVEESGDEVVVKTGNDQKTFKKQDVLHQSCRTCRYPNPVISDMLIGDPVEAFSLDSLAEVDEFAQKPADERWQYLTDDFNRCIRCYACRDACPFCYCTECFVDSSQPQWLGKSIDPSDTTFFHIMRAFHMAGRCVDCGACQRACPMGIDFRKLLKKLEHDVRDLYDYETGLDLESAAPLATFDPNDPQEFMIKE